MSSNRGHSGGELLLSKILGSMNTKRFWIILTLMYLNIGLILVDIQVE